MTRFIKHAVFQAVMLCLIASNASASFIFTAVGDYHSNSDTSATLDSIARSTAAFHLALGDLSYSIITPESAWCDYVKSHVGQNFPFQLISGNHEEDSGPDGFIGNFAAGLPDRMGSTGTYAARYYFDYQGLARIIMIAPDLTINGHVYDFSFNSTDYNWLLATIDSARAAGLPWVIVGMHKNCISIGNKTNEIGTDLMNLLLEKKVDIIFQGHEHNYQRSKQLALNTAGGCSALAANSFNSGCVADASSSTYRKGNGPLLIITGAPGGSQYANSINTSDSEAGYFTAWMGSNYSNVAGYSKFTVHPSSITGEFVKSAGSAAYADNFTITASSDLIVPSVPNGVTALALSSASINLSWSASSDNFGVSAYRVYRNGQLAPIASVSTTSHVDAGLTASTTYTYRVTAVDAAGNESAQSASVAVLTKSPQSSVSATLIAPGDQWKYFKGTTHPGSSWKSIGFNDAAWLSGPTGIGYADGDDATVLSDMRNNYRSVYCRKSFSVVNASAVISMTLTVNYDDGYVAYLNGQEVSRKGMPSGTPTNTTLANVSHEAGTPESVNISANISALVTGTNMLAVEVHNQTQNSSDLSFIPTLAVSQTTGPSTSDTQPPSVPVGLSVISISSSQINISWSASSDNVGVLGYKLFRGGVQISTPTSAGYSDTGLIASTTYSYAVSAFDAAGNVSAQSIAIATRTLIEPDLIAPSVPADLVALSVSSTAIDLAWSASTDNVGVAGYKLYRNGVQISSPAITNYSDAGLSASTTYNYTVSAFDAAGNVSAQSAAASTRTFTVPDVTSPTVPAGLSAIAISSTQINLSWSSSTDDVGVAGYNVFRNSVQIASVTTAIYSDTELLPSTTYTYAISAYDSAGNGSAQSSVVSTRTLDIPDSTAPSAPADLTGFAASAAQVILSWTASTDNIAVAGYKVFRNSIEIASASAASYSDAGLAASTTYFYAVSAYDAAGNVSELSSSASIRSLDIFDTVAPSTPTNLVAVATSTTQILLSWSASSDNVGAAGYKIFRDGILIASPSVVTYADSSLAPSTTYSYRVAAFDAAGNVSAQSVAATTRTFAIPDVTPPSVPTGLIALAASATQINLSWIASSDNIGVSGYKVFRNSVQIGSSAVMNFNDLGLTANTTYSYNVAAYDSALNVSSQSITVTTNTLPQSINSSEVIGLVRSNCSGYSNCYTSLAAWESAFGGVSFGTCAAGNLTCAKKIAAAQIDGSWVNVDTTPVIINGWTTNSTYYIKIYTAPEARHKGKWSTSTYRLESNSTPIEINEEYVRLDGLQVFMTDTSFAQWRRGIFTTLAAAAGNIQISNCIVRANGNIGNNCGGIWFETTGASSKFYIMNTIIYGFKTDGDYAPGIRTTNANWAGYVYNVTSNFNDYGIRNNGGAIIAKNTYAGGNTHSSYNGTITKTKCASSDGTGSAGLLNAAYSAASGAAFNSITAGSEDFHLRSASILKDAGVNTSTETAPLNFTQDADGETRSGFWDIGADEYGSAAFSAPSFGLFQDPNDVLNNSSALDPEFKLGEVYAYPNPAAGSKNPTIHIECGIADYVEIRFYDGSGTLLREARVDQVQIIDNKFAYEYTWNDSGIASGVYIYVVAAKKSGAQDLRIVKKLAIIK